MNSINLFETYLMGNVQLNNRIVMAPMTRARSDNDNHVATALTAKYYAQRATAGLIITEGTFISPQAVGVINVPGIYNAEQIEGWKLTTAAVHQKGGKIFAQLWQRFMTDAVLNQPDQDTFYTPGEKGYTDYPGLINKQ